ncbi:MAG: hypothetical protein KAH32_03545 [Chlamydiia bacterium]|nr:hypothetical protein [Chlamydiia bacterium]
MDYVKVMCKEVEESTTKTLLLFYSRNSLEINERASITGARVTTLACIMLSNLN